MYIISISLKSAKNNNIGIHVKYAFTVVLPISVTIQIIKKLLVKVITIFRCSIISMETVKLNLKFDRARHTPK